MIQFKTVVADGFLATESASEVACVAQPTATQPLSVLVALLPGRPWSPQAPAQGSSAACPPCVASALGVPRPSAGAACTAAQHLPVVACAPCAPMEAGGPVAGLLMWQLLLMTSQV